MLSNNLFFIIYKLSDEKSDDYSALEIGLGFLLAVALYLLYLLNKKNTDLSKQLRELETNNVDLKSLTAQLKQHVGTLDQTLINTMAKAININNQLRERTLETFADACKNATNPTQCMANKAAVQVRYLSNQSMDVVAAALIASYQKESGDQNVAHLADQNVAHLADLYAAIKALYAGMDTYANRAFMEALKAFDSMPDNVVVENINGLCANQHMFNTATVGEISSSVLGYDQTEYTAPNSSYSTVVRNPTFVPAGYVPNAAPSSMYTPGTTRTINTPISQMMGGQSQLMVTVMSNAMGMIRANVAAFCSGPNKNKSGARALLLKIMELAKAEYNRFKTYQLIQAGSMHQAVYSAVGNLK